MLCSGTEPRLHSGVPFPVAVHLGGVERCRAHGDEACETRAFQFATVATSTSFQVCCSAVLATLGVHSSATWHRWHASVRFVHVSFACSDLGVVCRRYSWGVSWPHCGSLSLVFMESSHAQCPRLTQHVLCSIPGWIMWPAAVATTVYVRFGSFCCALCICRAHSHVALGPWSDSCAVTLPACV